jgi:putative ABC transport system ATP-binding protein
MMDSAATNGTSNAPIALETNGVTKIYGSGDNQVVAVNQVSIRVLAGEFVALVGPSGSGKTTLLAVLAGLLRPTSGSVWIDGQELSRMSDGQRTRFRREKIGFTFQANNLVPYLTALENVELMVRLTGACKSECRERSVELLTQLGLGDRLHYLPRQLSGGQQQRVAIARALIHSPAVVLADEPTASLDSERAFQVVETFANLIHLERRAGIMVTHDMRLCRFVDRIVRMRDGQVAHIITDRAEIDALAKGE